MFVLFQQPKPWVKAGYSLSLLRWNKFSFCVVSGDKIAGKSFVIRDHFREIESKVQKLWEEAGVFRADAKDTPPKKGEKFFGNFPFPYMNGYLHVGHAFTFSKVEFAAAYHRLRGENVLFPFAFHCTGMPIKASADKIQREMEMFGFPPVFPVEKGEEVSEVERHDCNNRSRKSKVMAGSSRVKYQWEILRGYGLSDDEIEKFRNPRHWLTFFPALALEDLKAFGLGCDWRRTFITTNMNPYFDAFVRWQMRKLKSMGRIVNDLRYTIFSPLDGQPCADHDRASGEGVNPQEYTLIKMEVISPFPQKLSVLQGKKVYLAAATLRPETMYGQTNCWVLPDGKYGAFEVNDSEVFILTKRAALNLSYQRMSRIPDKPTCLAELTGQDLIGLPLRSPLAFNEVIYTLPMLSLPIHKGTGIVTCVPSDSTDDCKALRDLKSKPALRRRFHVKDEWVLPFEIIPIINHPNFGDMSAKTICIEKKIVSQEDDREKIDEANQVSYKEGLYERIMLVGEFSGMKVEEAKTLIRSKLLDLGQAVVYSEPEKEVISRSGDECVVALTDQWYITYGEAEWKKLAEECLAGMNLYSDEARNSFKHALTWLDQWACSRSFGLGTRIPWDEDFLVESLSDSTLYMPYYTVAHLLQRGDMYGKSPNLVKPEQLTDEVWDFLFVDGPYPKTSDIDSSLLNEMKKEFEYWYPFDLRVSGKDLIRNHLSFCIYNHTAIMPKHHWPRGFRCNAHVTLNGCKMSKSTGNFKTLRQAVEDYSADAIRFALADAGDGIDVANFVSKTADDAILYLDNEIKRMKKLFAAESSLRRGPPSTYADRVFANDMNIAIKMTEKNYSQYMFREALKTGFYHLQSARNHYTNFCGSGSMNRDLLWRFMDVQTRLIAPICPHYAEYVWKELLQKDDYVVRAGWPHADMPDLTLSNADKYLERTIISMCKLFQKQAMGTKNGNVHTASRQNKPTVGVLFVNEQFEGLRRDCLILLQKWFDPATLCFPPDEDILLELQKSASWPKEGNFKQLQRSIMPFLRLKKKEAETVGIHALDVKLPFSESAVLKENSDHIKRRIGLDHLEVVHASDADAVARTGSYAILLKANPPCPGEPTAIFLQQGVFPGGVNKGFSGSRDEWAERDDGAASCASSQFTHL